MKLNNVVLCLLFFCTIRLQKGQITYKMSGPSLLMDNLTGVSDECFDDIIQFFDFPLEDVEGNLGGEDWNAKLQLLEPPSLDVLTGLSSGFSGNICNDATKVLENSPAQVIFFF